MATHRLNDPNHNGLTEFLAAYERHVREILQPTQREIRAVFEQWLDPSYWAKYKRTNRIPIPSPVKTVSSRIKRPEQVVDKIYRKPPSFPAGLVPDSFERMHDTIGVRVIVYFLSHLPLIDRALRESPLLELDPDERPVAYLSAAEARPLGLEHLTHVQKESGYRAIHYTLRLTSSAIPADRDPWFELQVQTVTQDLWSTMEHHLGYKPMKGTHIAARRQFLILAQMLGAIDEHFNLLYEELNRYQEDVTYDDSDDLDAENLPSVLAELGISCAQRDINNILKLLYSRGLKTVHDLRSVASPMRLALIRNTYLGVTGRLPANLEVIASLAAVRGARDETAEIDRIKSQIAYRGAWDSIRQEFTEDQK